VTVDERSEDIKRRLAHQSQLKASEELARQVQDRTKTIKGWLKAAATAHGQLRVLTDAGRSVPVAASTAAVSACRRFAQKVGDHTAGNGDWATFKKVVEKQVSAVEGSVLHGATAAQAQVRELAIDNLEAMAKIRGKEAEFARLKQEKLNLNNENWANKSAEQLRDLLARLTRLVAGIESLSDLQAPPAVQTFLDNARRSDARVEDLTPKVRVWLEENDLLGRLRITLGGR
jgi:hypothetical protein